MIATIPRSGSTHFCIELWRTGVLGAPMEYVQIDNMWVLKNRLRFNEDFAGYWNSVQAIRTSPNGVFGYKMFMNNYRRLSAKNEALLTLIRPTHVIYFTREDEVEQAVSYSKALMTSQWFADATSKGAFRFDVKHIKKCLHLVRSQKKFWKNLFELTGASVLPITYEALLADKDRVLDAVCDFVGVIRTPAEALEIPYLSVQRDLSSSQWKESFRVALQQVCDDD